MELFCGDPICKKPVPEGPWPIRCPACRTNLYPRDILDASRPKDLEPKRGVLMTEGQGNRIEVISTQLAPRDTAKDAAKDADADAARIMDMVAQPMPLETRRGAPIGIIVAIALLVVLGGLALLLLL